MADAKFEKLQQILNLLNEGLTKTDFLKAFEGILNYVKKIHERNDLELQRLRETYDGLSGDLKKEFASAMKKIEARMDNESITLRALSEAVVEKMNSMRDGKDGVSIQGPAGRDGKDGKDADEEKIAKNAAREILNSGEEIRKSLERLESDDRLDKSAIKGLDEWMRSIAGGRRFAILGGGRNAVEYTDLSSLLDGVTKTFSVPKRRFVALMYSSAPFIYRPTVDYTGDGTGTLTLTSEVSAPETGQSLILLHSRL